MLAAGVVGAVPGCAQAQCVQPEVGFSVAALRSHWREQDERGRRLVEERGTLRQLGMGAALSCGPWVLGLQLAQARGRRGYDGVDSGGAPIASTSALVQSELKLEALRLAVGPWLLGGRLLAQRVDRDIASAGAALGYPERFRWWQAQVGTRAAFELAPGRQLALDAWFGGGPGGKVAARLPHADPVTLGLGHSRAAELGLALASSTLLRRTDRTGWGWRLRLQCTLQDIGAGAAKPLMRNGAVVGGAAQPAIRQQSWGLSLGIVGWF